MDLGERFQQATRWDALEGRFDPWLLGGAVALACLGVVMVASSSLAVGESLQVNEFYFLIRHAIYLGAGLVAAGVLMRCELKTIERYNQLLLLGCFILLLAVLLPGIGSSVNGARRWLNLGVAKFQAIEAVKLMFVVWLASYLVRNRDELDRNWMTLLKPLGVLATLVAVLLMQPDFGSATLLLAIGGTLIFLGGAPIRRLLALGLPALAAMAALAVAAPYRLARLTNFRDPWQDPFDDGYQLIQSLIAIGRGEWFGVGLGGSVQKLQAFPEVHTDFIFSVYAEEFGLVGVAVLVGLYALVVGRALLVGQRALDMRRPFAGFIALGIGTWIGLQALVSMGVNLGLLPTKGLTLPLISYGGSSLLATCAAFGLLLRVSLELDRAGRQSARLRGEGALPRSEDVVLAGAGRHAPRRPRERIEPRLEAGA
jgi:cell division protein FtsW